MKESVSSLILKIITWFKERTFPLKIEEESPTQDKDIGVEHLSSLLKRLSTNPILKPIIEHSWESKAVFNPAVLFEDGKVHFVYRAVGSSDISVFGYANSQDGVNISERSTSPVYLSNEQLIRTSYRYVSGPGFGGCEDPRITKINDRLYMTYTAFNGSEPPRVALTSIAVEDFLENNWNWRYPVIISPPNEIHKNWVIFPEKINGKYAILHSISPNILIKYVDSLEFDQGDYIKSRHDCSHRTGCWDNLMRGVGPPPVKTKDGWLVFYHAMDKNDPNRYKVGAMLLDLDDPTQVLYRSPKPVLEPDAKYENEGLKAGVVYVCGVVVLGEKLIIYYGGADTVTCGVTTNLENFLANLKNSQPTSLKLTINDQIKKRSGHVKAS